MFSFLENYFVTRYIKRMMRQGNQDINSQKMFSKIVDLAREEYTEDNDTTLYVWLMENFDCAAANELKFIHPKARYKYV